LIVKRGTGFIYYVSREGVTGMQTQVSASIADMTAKFRAHTQLPIAVASASRSRPGPRRGAKAPKPSLSAAPS